MTTNEEREALIRQIAEYRECTDGGCHEDVGIADAILTHFHVTRRGAAVSTDEEPLDYAVFNSAGRLRARFGSEEHAEAFARSLVGGRVGAAPDHQAEALDPLPYRVYDRRGDAEGRGRYARRGYGTILNPRPGYSQNFEDYE